MGTTISVYSAVRQPALRPLRSPSGGSRRARETSVTSVISEFSRPRSLIRFYVSPHRLYRFFFSSVRAFHCNTPRTDLPTISDDCRTSGIAISFASLRGSSDRLVTERVLQVVAVFRVLIIHLFNINYFGLGGFLFLFQSFIHFFTIFVFFARLSRS